MLITVLPPSLLQTVCKMIFFLEVIIKSIIEPDDKELVENKLMEKC